MVGVVPVETPVYRLPVLYVVPGLVSMTNVFICRLVDKNLHILTFLTLRTWHDYLTCFLSKSQSIKHSRFMPVLVVEAQFGHYCTN